MSTYLKDKRIDIFYDDGQLVMSFNLQTGESSSYHENGNLYLLLLELNQLYIMKIIESFIGDSK